ARYRSRSSPSTTRCDRTADGHARRAGIRRARLAAPWGGGHLVPGRRRLRERLPHPRDLRRSAHGQTAPAPTDAAAHVLLGVGPLALVRAGVDGAVELVLGELAFDVDA